MTEPFYLWGFFHPPPHDIIIIYYRKEGCQGLVAAPFSSLGSQRLKQKVKAQRDKKRQTFAIILQHWGRNTLVCDFSLLILLHPLPLNLCDDLLQSLFIKVGLVLPKKCKLHWNLVFEDQTSQRINDLLSLTVIWINTYDALYITVWSLHLTAGCYTDSVQAR